MFVYLIKFIATDLFSGIVQDLDDFASMVDEAMILVSGYYYNKIDAPAAVHLFFDLYNNNFRKYRVDEEHLRCIVCSFSFVLYFSIWKFPMIY